MYKHHEESIEIMKNFFMEREEVIAVILGGSIAKGCERPDSDLDAMVIITPEAYDERVKSNTTVETIFGHCTYEGGYFDTKYMTKEYLIDAAKHASEPTRNSFDGARVIYSKDPEIESILNQVPVFQKSEQADKMLSFFADYSLNYGYFLKMCKPEGFMRLHAIGEIIYSVYRMILQEKEVLFPCNRRLEETVDGLADKPENIVELGQKLAADQTDESADAFVNAYLAWRKYPLPEDYSHVLSRYTADFEQWWREPRPLVNEW